MTIKAGLTVKVIERDAADHLAERFGNADFFVVGDVKFALVAVKVHLGLECVLDLANVAAEFDDPLAFADFVHGEALGLQPG